MILGSGGGGGPKTCEDVGGGHQYLWVPGELCDTFGVWGGSPLPLWVWGGVPKVSGGGVSGICRGLVGVLNTFGCWGLFPNIFGVWGGL